MKTLLAAFAAAFAIVLYYRVKFKMSLVEITGAMEDLINHTLIPVLVMIVTMIAVAFITKAGLRYFERRRQRESESK